MGTVDSLEQELARAKAVYRETKRRKLRGEVSEQVVKAARQNVVAYETAIARRDAVK